jgi:FkbM family methyltransferase
MGRPLLMRSLPPALRMRVWSRLYAGRHGDFVNLYDAAPLHYAPAARLRLVPGDVISDSIAFTGVYEHRLTRRIARLAKEGGTMIEVGANLGYFSVLWLSLNEDNRLYAFEASPPNVQRLRANLERNGVASRATVLPVAAGAERGRMHFDPGPADQTGWGGLTGISSERTQEVEVVRVDEAVPHEVPYSILKIDTEGADPWVLQGASRLLYAGQVREIWFEENKGRMQALGAEIEPTRALLLDAGFSLKMFGKSTDDTVDWCATRDSSGRA